MPRCGLKGGAAHCDYAEIEACFDTNYVKDMPKHLLRPFNQLK